MALSSLALMVSCPQISVHCWVEGYVTSWIRTCARPWTERSVWLQVTRCPTFLCLKHVRGILVTSGQLHVECKTVIFIFSTEKRANLSRFFHWGLEESILPDFSLDLIILRIIKAAYAL